MYEGMKRADGAVSNRMIDLRSDTVTQPTPAMRDAMLRADVGDDVYGEDPTILALEAKVAGLLGKEAAVFVSSGTQSNLLGVLSHCERGDEYLIGDCYHVFQYEAMGTSVLGSVAAYPLKTDAAGGLDPDQVVSGIKPDDAHKPITKLLSLENTVSGRVQDQDRIDALSDVAHANGLKVHMDGARLMNAAVSQGRSAEDLVAKIDTVSICLSKGLGAPVGSVLAGPSDNIRKARRMRKMLGGGMRQAGVIAAAGLHALDHHVDRMAEDHANARVLAEGLAEIGPIQVDLDAVNTNMVFAGVPAADQKALQAYLGERGIIIGNGRPAIRMVTHLDVTADDMTRVVEEIASFYASR